MSTRTFACHRNSADAAAQCIGLDAYAEGGILPSSFCNWLTAANRTLGVDDENLGGRDADGEVADLVGVAVAKARIERVVLRREQRADVLPLRHMPTSALCVTLAARGCGHQPLRNYFLLKCMSMVLQMHG